MTQIVCIIKKYYTNNSWQHVKYVTNQWLTLLPSVYMLTSYSPWHWHLWSFFSSVQIKEPAELMTHESSTIRGHHNIGIHPEDRGMGPYSSYGMHTLFLFTYSLQLCTIMYIIITTTVSICTLISVNIFVLHVAGTEGT